ncbi:tRNA nucleotidyltransferase/poly(A) polymerase family protein [Leptospira inadai serovar Lyme str. 10]|uniref:tRNA nucleotidyltransferase/poly(A) polymerase family protein n=2 Tax=Leptospira inadai serovar Lyme TaxID=293084 RepID=V6HTX2_9LEPT|nr:CCA tRNA nucleotidyltransferase [Leptospira inadai]EQA36179.1 tRNA nucleotidyltransferase/poly(A) polymerase family protein [Leptospira inadai serovar Lyme str. 10]PNV74932.1 CCA tRNA nucleotidyltransferase [Leptospira inadai serovar Lyme]
MKFPSAKELIQGIPSPYIEDLLEIANTIQSFGGKSYLVGGSVRDLVLGKTPHEYDIAVSLLPEQIQKLFRRVVPTGIKHGTVTVLIKDRSYELTTFRKDEEYKDGRRPEQVSFGVSLSEDLKRRDFTMNALALDILREDLVDEHEGLNDIAEKTIRTIGVARSRFEEDGLRPVRAIRFVSQLGFTIHPKTALAIQESKSITAKVSAERIHDEFLKILKAKDPSASLSLLRKFGILELFYGKDLYENANPAWEEKIKSIAELATAPDRLRISYFLKATFGSSAVADPGKRFCKALHFSNQRTKDSQFLCGILENLLSSESSLSSPIGLRKILLHPIAQYSGKSEIRQVCLELASFWKAWTGQRASWVDRAKEVLETNPPLLLSDLELDGTRILEELPEIPAKKIGEILKSSLDLVLNFPEKNQQRILLEFVKTTYRLN